MVEKGKGRLSLKKARSGTRRGLLPQIASERR
jgi:hypothetical protein